VKVRILNPALKHTAMAQHEVNGNLFVRYNGEVYPSQDYQCDIKFITSDIGEQFFEFEFAYPNSPTKEKVFFSVNEEHKKRVINPFNLQYIVIGENDWIVSFEMIEEFQDTAEYFSAFARFKTDIPIPTHKRILRIL
jgi:hypothetical protein